MTDNVKETVAQITIVATMVFKLFIFGAVLIFYSEAFPQMWYLKLAVIISGIFWTLGMQNINMMFHIFRKE